MVGAPREEISFLARSENRVAVLRALGPDPMSRVELAERTGVKRVTLGRILDDFTERGWIERSGQSYALTPAGEMIASDFTQLLETVDTADKLGGLLQWLPTEEMGFDLARLGCADVTLPSGPDPAAPTRQAGQRLRKASDVRLLMSVIVADVVDACWDATVNGDQRLEAVFTPDVLRTIADDGTMRDRVSEMLQCDRVTVYCTDATFDHTLGLLDDRVAFGVTDEENLPRAYVELGDDVVREWAATTYEQYRDGATRLDRNELPPPESIPQRLPGIED